MSAFYHFSYRVVPFSFRSVGPIVRNIFGLVELWNPFYLPLVPNLVRDFADQCLVFLFYRGHSALLYLHFAETFDPSKVLRHPETDNLAPIVRVRHVSVRRT